MFYDNSFQGTMLLWEIIISIIQALAAKMHPAYPPVCLGLLLPTSEIIEMWQMLNYCYFKTQWFLVNNISFKHYCAGLPGIPCRHALITF